MGPSRFSRAALRAGGEAALCSAVTERALCIQRLHFLSAIDGRTRHTQTGAEGESQSRRDGGESHHTGNTLTHSRGRQASMARTMQTARKSIGGHAPRQQRVRTMHSAPKRKKRRSTRTDDSVVRVAPDTFVGFKAELLQVKKRVRVKWPKIDGSTSAAWYAGVIRAVYPNSKRVSILYDHTTTEICDRLDLEWQPDESEDEDDKSVSDEEEFGKEGIDWGRSCLCGGDRDLPHNSLPFSGIWLFCDSCKYNCGHAECCPQLQHLSNNEKELRKAAEADNFLWTCPACQDDSDASAAQSSAPVAACQAEQDAPGPDPGAAAAHASSVQSGDDAQNPICLE